MSAPSEPLTSLQRRILETLAGLEPVWTLVGGAALAGFHLHHRATRDLDLFWRERESLGEIASLCADRLRSKSFRVRTVQSGFSFSRLDVSDDTDSTVIDLVAEPAAFIEAPMRVSVGGAEIQVATRREILTDKLCALLGRSEVRDLVDVRALVEAGEDLGRAIDDAPRRDAGFSPLVLSWLLKGMQVEARATAVGLSASDADALRRFRDDLVARLNRGAPGET